MAVTEPEAAPHERASMILVPTDAPGFEIVRNIPVMGHAGDDYFSHSEIEYKNCRVPASSLLGRRGQGFAIAQERLGPGRIHHCMRWLGICRRAFDMMCDHALERTIGPDATLADKELVQAWIAETYAEIEAARTLTLQTASRIDREGWRAARQTLGDQVPGGRNPANAPSTAPYRRTALSADRRHTAGLLLPRRARRQDLRRPRRGAQALARPLAPAPASPVQELVVGSRKPDAGRPGYRHARDRGFKRPTADRDQARATGPASTRRPAISSWPYLETVRDGRRVDGLGVASARCGGIGGQAAQHQISGSLRVDS